MSVTTWKTASPSFLSKISGFLLCIKKPERRKSSGRIPPELDAGIGKGLTATEIAEAFVLKKKNNNNDTMSVRSALGEEAEEDEEIMKKRNKKNSLIKAANEIKNKKEEKAARRGLISNKSSKSVKKEKLKIQIEELDDDLNWLTEPFREEDDLEDNVKGYKRSDMSEILKEEEEKSVGKKLIKPNLAKKKRDDDLPMTKEEVALAALDRLEEDSDVDVADVHIRTNGSGQSKTNSAPKRVIKIKENDKEEDKVADYFGKKENRKMSASSSSDSDAEYRSLLRSIKRDD